VTLPAREPDQMEIRADSAALVGSESLGGKKHIYRWERVISRTGQLLNIISADCNLRDEAEGDLNLTALHKIDQRAAETVKKDATNPRKINPRSKIQFRVEF